MRVRYTKVSLKGPMHLIKTVCSLLFFLALPAHAGELYSDAYSHSTMQIALETDGFSAGEQHWLAITIEPKSGWHTYWRNPGDSGAAPLFTWSVPNGVTVGSPVYPVPETLPLGPLMNYGYHGNSTLLFPLSVGGDFLDNTIPVSLVAEWLVCEIECVPQVAEITLQIPQGGGVVSSETAATFLTGRSKLPEPSYWDSNFTFSNDFSELLVFADKLDLEKNAQVYFFPDHEGAVSYAAPQEWYWTEFGLKGSFVRDPGSPVPAALGGLLKVTFNDGTSTAYELTPTLTNNVREDTKTLGAAGMPVWQALLFALLGGLILNLMPCVFPVLSLKAFALISANYKTQANRRKEGWAYTFGIWSSFMIIVGVLLLLRSTGAAIGWGFQLQEPMFIGFLGLLMVLVSLSLAGVFYIRLGFEGIGQTHASREGLVGSFSKGVLATLVATPCTAPLMAPAIGFALTQPIVIVFSVFSALAFGLALPFLLLSYSDTLVKLMPRPGIWMEKVKHGLAFPMLLTAAWLVYIYTIQAGAQATLFLLVAMVLLSFGVWLWQQTTSMLGRIVAVAAVAASILLITVPLHTPQSPDRLNSPHTELVYSEEALAELLREDKSVFVYFTAEWCITCKVNEQVALFTDDVQNELVAQEILLMKGDWTNRNAEIAAVLAKYDRAGVPLYLYFPKGEKSAKVLPEILTKNIILEYLANS